MSTPSKWFLAVASLFVVFVGTFLIVYDQPKSQAIPPAKLKLETPVVEEVDAKKDLAFLDKGFYEEVKMESNENIRIDLLRDYLMAIVNVDEYNIQQLYKGEYTLSNKDALMAGALIGVLMDAEIQHDTTDVLQAHKDYVEASNDYQYLIVSPDEKVTPEEQKEIEKAQLKFETASQELVDSVDQLYP